MSDIIDIIDTDNTLEIMSDVVSVASLSGMSLMQDDAPVAVIDEQSALLLTETLTEVIELTKGYGDLPVLPVSKTFVYEAGRIVRIDSANGDSKSFTYAPNGDISQIDTVQDNVHIRKTLNYDASGNVVAVTVEVI